MKFYGQSSSLVMPFSYPSDTLQNRDETSASDGRYVPKNRRRGYPSLNNHTPQSLWDLLLCRCMPLHSLHVLQLSRNDDRYDEAFMYYWKARLVVSCIILTSGLIMPIIAVALLTFHGNSRVAIFPIAFSGLGCAFVVAISFWNFRVNQLAHALGALLWCASFAFSMLMGNLAGFLIVLQAATTIVPILIVETNLVATAIFWSIASYGIFVLHAINENVHFFTTPIESKHCVLDTITTIPALLAVLEIVVVFCAQFQQSVIHELQMSRADIRRAMAGTYRAADVKNHFLSNMSHELRTPLVSVLGVTEALYDSSNLNACEKEQLSVARSSCHILLNILDDILDLSKMESNAFTLDMTTVNLNELVYDVALTFSIPAFRKGLELLCFLREGAIVTTDSNRLRQVLVSLMSNAVKYTSAGCIILDVSIHKKTCFHQNCNPTNSSDTSIDPDEHVDSKERLAVRLSVSDQGPGIAPAMQQEIFKPFFQGHSLQKHRKHGGLGMGLTIVQNLGKALGAQLSLDSTVGQGSTFHLDFVFEGHMIGEIDHANHELLVSSPSEASPVNKTLPIHHDLSFIGHHPSFESPRASHPVPERKRTVLIVEDVERAADWLREGLAFLGFMTTVWARNATEMLEKLHQLSVCVILLDSSLPDLNNEILGAIFVPVVFMTHLQDPHALRVALGDSYCGFVRKPICTWDDLGRRLRQVVMGKVGSNRSLTDFVQRELGEHATENQCNYIWQVLVVDDVAVNLKVAKNMLKRAEPCCEIHTFDNAREAIAYIENHTVDIVFMDVHMPDMDGLEATAELRRLSLSNRVPSNLYIVALTADIYAKANCLKAGCNDYLRKPYRLRDMKKILQKSTVVGVRRRY